MKSKAESRYVQQTKAVETHEVVRFAIIIGVLLAFLLFLLNMPAYAAEASPMTAKSTATKAKVVAKVGETSYKNLNDAIKAAEPGQDVVMLNDVNLSGGRVTVSKGITLDMNGHTIASSVDMALEVYSRDSEMGSAVVENGTISCTGMHALYIDSPSAVEIRNCSIQSESSGNTMAVYVCKAKGETRLVGCNVVSNGTYGVIDNGKLSLASTNVSNLAEEGQTFGICMMSEGATLAIDPESAIYADSDESIGVMALCSHDKVDVSGSIEAGYVGIATGGGESSCTNCSVEVLDGADIEASTGVCCASPGSIVSVYGGNIEGEDVGIEIQCGSLSMSGGVVEASGEGQDPDEDEEDQDGGSAGIFVYMDEGAGSVSVDISGGTVKGYTALSEISDDGEGAQGMLSMSITGGKFVATDGGTEAIVCDDADGFISGGTFSTDVTDYCADGYEAKRSGSFYGIVRESEDEDSDESDESLYGDDDGDEWDDEGSDEWDGEEDEEGDDPDGFDATPLRATHYMSLSPDNPAYRILGSSIPNKVADPEVVTLPSRAKRPASDEGVLVVSLADGSSIANGSVPMNGFLAEASTPANNLVWQVFLAKMFPRAAGMFSAAVVAGLVAYVVLRRNEA